MEVKKCLGQIFVGLKICWEQYIWKSKKFWKKHFGSPHLVGKTFWGPKICRKNILGTKICWTKIVGSQSIFMDNKFWGSKMLWAKKIWGSTILGVSLSEWSACAIGKLGPWAYPIFENYNWL